MFSGLLNKLVGGFTTNPSTNYARQVKIISPRIRVNIQIFELPPPGTLSQRNCWLLEPVSTPKNTNPTFDPKKLVDLVDEDSLEGTFRKYVSSGEGCRSFSGVVYLSSPKLTTYPLKNRPFNGPPNSFQTSIFSRCVRCLFLVSGSRVMSQNYQSAQGEIPCLGGWGPEKKKMTFPTYLGVSKNRGTPKWTIYNGNPY